MLPQITTRHLSTALAVAAGSLLAVPAAGHASQDFGSRLKNEPANSGECYQLSGPCALISFIHPSDPNGDPYSGGAPVSGVITKFKVRAKSADTNPVTAALRVADISRQSPDQATATGRGSNAPVQLVANGQIEEHPARLSVKQGQHLGLDVTNAQVTYNSSGSKFTYRFSPALGNGGPPALSAQATGELLVRATIEPDRDHDGYGDETQDRCPSQASTAGQCDRRAPHVARIKLGAKRLRYRLSEAGSVKVSVQKRRHGHWITSKSIRAKSVKGANKVGFRTSLHTGRYRVQMRATDLNGNRSGLVSKRFRINR